MGPRTAKLAPSICLKMKKVEVLKEWLFSQWIPADFMPVVMTPHSVFIQSLYLSVVCVLLKHISHTRICYQRKWRLQVLIFVKHDQAGDVEIQESFNYGVQYIGTDILIMIALFSLCNCAISLLLQNFQRLCIFCKLKPQNSATMNKIYVIFFSLLCY